MYPTIATAYDQNPARIASIARKNRKHPAKDRSFVFGLLATAAAGFAFAFSHLLSRA